MLGALALGVWPRRRSPLRMAAFTAVLLIGFELVLTHWSYLYLPWFFPFVAMALIAPARRRARRRRDEAEPPPVHDRKTMLGLRRLSPDLGASRHGRGGGDVPRRLGADPPLVLGATAS